MTNNYHRQDRVLHHKCYTLRPSPNNAYEQELTYLTLMKNENFRQVFRRYTP